MKNYQRFKIFFEQLKEDFDKRGLFNIDIHMKDSFYKKVGISDKDTIRQLEVKKTKEMNDRLDLGLSLTEEYGSVYEVEDDVMRYITMNKTPPKDIIKKMKLPFKSIFIETEITRDDVDIGIDKIGGILIEETSILSKVDEKFTKNMKYKNEGRIFLVYYFCEDQNKYWIDEFKIRIDEYKDDIKIVYSDMKTFRFLRNFLMNFILFINDPEIELVVHKRGEKNRLRRIRERKIPLPSSRKIRIIGKLKKYVDSVSHGLKKGKFNYRFWVSGHYRTLRSDKFKHKKGQIIRIEPYIKGEGVLLKRTYELSFEKDDDRKPDELTLGDIK